MIGARTGRLYRGPGILYPVIDFRYFLGFSIMSTNKNDLSANSIHWWRERGVFPVTWTVNTFDEKKFFARHRVPVMTDSMTQDAVEQS